MPTRRNVRTGLVSESTEVQMVSLVAISTENRSWVNEIKAGPPELYQLHYNAQWYGQSCLHDDVWSFLVQDGAEDYCGFITYGQCYEDEYLSANKVNGTGEICHLVISPEKQRQGIGSESLKLACEDLANKGYDEVRVAHSPESRSARAFYVALGFEPFGINYDGDPYLSKRLMPDKPRVTGGTAIPTR